MKMICLIRIRGQIGIERSAKETMHRLRIRKKYSCVVIKNPTPVEMGMIAKIKNFIAWGEITEADYKKLVDARGIKVEGKLKPFFRLHPPRGGAETRLHYPKGILGDNGKDIIKLLERML